MTLRPTGGDRYGDSVAAQARKRPRRSSASGLRRAGGRKSATRRRAQQFLGARHHRRERAGRPIRTLDRFAGVVFADRTAGLVVTLSVQREKFEPQLRRRVTPLRAVDGDIHRPGGFEYLLWKTGAPTSGKRIIMAISRVLPSAEPVRCAAVLLGQAEYLALRYGSMSGSPQLRSELDALLRRVASRDVEAFAAFYDLTRTRVFGMVVRVLRDPGYSEETTQDVYLQVWRSAARFDPSAGSALTWLLTLAHRRAVDRVRAEQAASEREARYSATVAEPAGDVVAESAILSEDHRRVAECVNSLTDAQRQCVELAYYGGLTYAEVAERLQANLATIKSRMRDALRNLRNCLGMS